MNEVSEASQAKILLVCAANICRSPAAEVVMQEMWQVSSASSQLNLNIESAGARAMAGMPRCAMSESFVGKPYEASSQELPVGLSRCDLILTMERSHRGPIVVSSPNVRSRVFTLVEVAQLAAFITGSGLVLDAATGHVAGEDAEFDFDAVPPLPSDTSARWQWFTSELDAWRGQVPMDLLSNSPAAVDISDPHDYQQDMHAESFAQITEAVGVFIKALTEVMSR